MCDYFTILKRYTPFITEDFERIYQCDGRSVSLKVLIEDQLGKTISAEEPDMGVICEAMGQYISSFPAPATYKQVLWEKMKLWLERIADDLGQQEEYEMFLEDFEPPVSDDPIIHVIKALHNRDGITREDIARELCESERNAKNILNRLDASLTDGHRGNIVRIAGQEVSVCIESEDRVDTRRGDTPVRKRYFHTPNTVNPIFLQENIMQVGTLLKSLAQSYYTDEGYENEIVLGIALDIWLQLSEYAKERISSFFVAGDKKLSGLIRDVENRVEEGSGGFMTEKEMLHEMMANGTERLEDLLIDAWKTGRKVDIQIELDGEVKLFENVVISSDNGRSFYIKDIISYEMKRKDGRSGNKARFFTVSDVISIEWPM